MPPPHAQRPIETLASHAPALPTSKPPRLATNTPLTAAPSLSHPHSPSTLRTLAAASSSGRGAPTPKRGRATVASPKRSGGALPTSRRAPPAKKESSPGRFYLNVTGFPFPLGPFLNRATYRTEVDPGRVWTFEQPQSLGFSSVTANVRMTVIKLACGGLWIHAPIAPTAECVRLVKELGAPVKYIVLPTFAYEHKAFMAPFCRAFPQADAFVAPRQWSWPVNLPVQFFGIFPKGVVEAGATMPWQDEIDHRPFSSSVGVGPYSEVAFFHKPTRTLLVTDAVVRVPLTPPAVVAETDLLDSGGPLPGVVAALSGGGPGAPPPPPPPTDPAARAALGWQRMALQILFFVPGDLARPGGSFTPLVNRLLVSPVLRKLVYGNARAECRAWVNDVCTSWAFTRIIPAHFDAPIAARPADLLAAFSFIEEDAAAEGEVVVGEAPAGATGGILGAVAGLFGSAGGKSVTFKPSDMRALDGLAGSLKTTGVLNK